MKKIVIILILLTLILTAVIFHPEEAGDLSRGITIHLIDKYGNVTIIEGS